MRKLNTFSEVFNCFFFNLQKRVNTSCVYTLDIFCGLRQCMVHCGFIFPYKESALQQFWTHSLGMVPVASFLEKKKPIE